MSSSGGTKKVTHEIVDYTLNVDEELPHKCKRQVSVTDVQVSTSAISSEPRKQTNPQGDAKNTSDMETRESGNMMLDTTDADSFGKSEPIPESRKKATVTDKLQDVSIQEDQQSETNKVQRAILQTKRDDKEQIRCKQSVIKKDCLTMWASPPGNYQCNIDPYPLIIVLLTNMIPYSDKYQCRPTSCKNKELFQIKSSQIKSQRKKYSQIFLIILIGLERRKWA